MTCSGYVSSWLLAAMLACASTAIAAPATPSPKQLALLVGIARYEGRPLEGPANDVTALRDVLVRRWGYRPSDIRVLLDGDATRSRILGELAALQARSSPGD